jgi:hypothetical protein
MDQMLQEKPGFSKIREFTCRTWPRLVVCLIFCTGCSRSASPEPVPTPEGTALVTPLDPSTATATTDGPESEAIGNDASKSTAKRRRGEVWVDENGQKWFGNVPMDAFFNQPYTVANDPTPISGGDEAEAATNTSEKDSAEVPERAPPPKSRDSWDDLISATELDDEVKTIRNFLHENLQSVSNYNSSMLMIPPKAATLGALAGVAMEHPLAVSWKDDAKYVRDLAKKMNADTLRSGPKDQKRLFALYEALSDTLSRSRPADLEEPPDSDGFADVSEMRLLMFRLEEAEKRLKTEAGTESGLGSRKEMVAHEATMMATLAKIVTLPGYGYEDDPRFKGYADEVIQSALAIKTAAADNDFAGYELALTRVSTNCSNCHSDYKNN